MATASLTRRALFGATVCATVAVMPLAAAAHPALGRTEWDRAMRAYLSAKTLSDADNEAFERVRLDKGISREQMQEAWDRNNKLGEKMCEALDALIEMPAPDVEALKWKFDYLFEPNREGSAAGWDISYIQQTLDDALRLARA